MTSWSLLLLTKWWWWCFAISFSAALFGTVLTLERGGGKEGWGYRYRRYNLHFAIGVAAIFSIVCRCARASLRMLLHSN
jgi:hypothetical protein